MNHDDYVAYLGPQIDAFVQLANSVDLELTVPSCPGWNVAQLVAHQGEVHRWAEWHVANLAPERQSMQALGIAAPSARDELLAWFEAGAAQLLATLRGCQPDAAMWAWGTDQHARFWSRRQLHETVVHLADAQLAAGSEPSVPASVAVDTIDELLDNLPAAAYFAPKVKELRGAGETIHLHCTDADGEWMITLEPEGFRYEHAHGKGTVAVRGSASDLAFLLYNRRDLDDGRFETFGDDALIRQWLINAAL